MTQPPQQSPETQRLNALADLCVLDTPEDPDLNDLVLLASSICGTPISTITFVDSARQWFMARVGLDIQETPRDIAFCNVTVMRGVEMIIPDASSDPQFRNNPLVTGPPFLRFYAGLPLVTLEGQVVGTLTVMDTVPRELSEFQMFALRVLLKQVVRWLELRGHLTAHQVSLHHALAARTRAERFYQSLYETTVDTVVIIDTDSRIRFASPNALELLQYTPDEMVGKPLSLIQPERYRQFHLEGMKRYLESGVKTMNWRSTEINALRKDGSEVPVEIAFSEMEQDGDRLFVGFFRNIEDRKKVERALFEQKEEAQATLRSIGDGVVVVDEMGRITYMNPLAEQFTLCSDEEARGRSHEEVLDFIDADGQKLFGFGPLPDNPHALTPLPGRQLQLKRSDGRSLYVEGSIARLSDSQGRRAGSVIAFRDITTRLNLEAQVSHQATHDALTGLINRGEFERRLRNVAEGGDTANRQHSLLYIDLDQFKVVNDTSGHTAGDELLKQVSVQLRLHLRANDTLARLGGDEFGLLLENCPVDRAIKIAEELRLAIAEHVFMWGDRVFGITISVGHVYFGGEAMALSEVMGRADEACFMAKDLGRNRVHTYNTSDADLARRHGEMEWVSRTRHALREGKFVLFAQEIVALNDKNEEPHLEVLLRMQGDDGKLIGPMSFIPAAERYNLMPAIDRWVISTVLDEINYRITQDSAAAIACYAINLSGASVTDAHLAAFVRDELARTKVPGHCLCFEITETAAISNLGHAILLMEELKLLGCRFSLDDFGSGMSSFAHLKQLPVDFLKIDGAFVRDIARDPIDRAMVAAIHQIGKLMGLETIAEYVEDDAIIRELKQIGVDFGQGYGLARPAPFGTLAEKAMRTASNP